MSLKPIPVDMAEEIAIERKAGFLQFTVGGEFSVGLAMKVIDLIIEKCQEWDQKKALVNVSGMGGKMTIIDRLRVGMYATVLLKYNIVTALIGNLDQVLPDNFLENFMVNRGVRMRIFTSVESGRQWLLEIDNG